MVAAPPLDYVDGFLNCLTLVEQLPLPCGNREDMIGESLTRSVDLALAVRHGVKLEDASGAWSSRSVPHCVPGAC